jgi:membrane-bound lytic murein transglycosylase D
MSSLQLGAGKIIFKTYNVRLSNNYSLVFMKKIALISLLVLLGGCELTDLSSDEAVSAETYEQEIAAQIHATCEEHGSNVDNLFDCDSAQQGTIPVTHPTDVIEVPLEVAKTEVPEKAEQNEPPITDVWDRIRQQLHFEVPKNSRVENQKNWYLKHPNYMQRVSKRAKPFLYLIVEQLEKDNMPLELALLPIVESAFDPFAYSHGRAAGMWQFIPGTGKRFGMKQTWWYDGRRDVIASTEGAIAYLNYLVKMFDGDWLHALAAYNSGEGRVRKAIRKNKNARKPTDFWSLDLPKETRAYVPKLLALADILTNSQSNGFDWPKIDNAAVTQVVKTDSQIDLAVAADMAGLTLKELHALNPGFNRWATDPDGPHRLILPIDKVEGFKLALNDTSDKQRLNWVRHKVKNGDSLIKLAKQYHTTVNVIQQVNEMNGNMIRVGDFLLVPVALKSLDQYSLSQDQRLATTQSKKRGGSKLTHKVKNGDTMWDLSRKFDVNVRSLAKWNGMAPTDTLHPGKNLVIWVNQVSDQQRKDAVMRSLTYTVRKGDSLARIASKFKVKIDDIQRWNQINPNRYLQPGQKLKLFVDVTRT